MQEAKVWLDKSVNVEDALVICCFPSVGMVSSIVAHFLIDHLKLEFVGGVAHPKLPPLSLVNNGKPMPQSERTQENLFVKSKGATKSYS